MKKANRTEPNWKKIKFNEPYEKAIKKFREKVQNRPDFDPATLLQFGIFMAKSLLQMLEDIEENFGPEGQKVCNEALEKVGRDLGKQMFGNLEITPDIPSIELISYVATWINTVAWTSIEDPRIVNDKKCEFDIIWCPLEDVYKAFDCRIQRYLVQGIIDYVRDRAIKIDPQADFDVEFLSTIPAGAETCKFQIVKKDKKSSDKWRQYSKILEKRALKRWKSKKESKIK
ncbi:MAG: hypothetical protein ACTSO9_09980 [Candidatus Helarchaeota archaeon]